MNKLILLMTFFVPTICFSQTIDCSVYQSQVNDMTSEINNANKALSIAQVGLNSCKEFQNVVKSDVYKQAVALREIKATFSEDVPVSTSTSKNWSDLNTITPSK